MERGSARFERTPFRVLYLLYLVRDIFYILYLAARTKLRSRESFENVRAVYLLDVTRKTVHTPNARPLSFVET